MDMKEELKTAICNNDFEFLEKNKGAYIIDERFDDEGNETLLLYSLSDSGSNTYNFLIENGADITATNDEGENVIHSIVFSGDNERLKKILNDYKGVVDINHQSKDGATPLLLAISLEKNELAITLIENGADVNVSDHEGMAPIHLASQSSDISLVKLLSKNGANLNLKTKKGNLPLALAVNGENDEIVKFLFKKIYQ